MAGKWIHLDDGSEMFVDTMGQEGITMSDKLLPKLKSCPFCRSIDIAVFASKFNCSFRVGCNECDAQGPYCEHREDAIMTWNNRRCEAAVTEWRPIDTAPRDGTEIILRKGGRVTAGAWDEWTDTVSEYHGTTGVYLGESIQGGGAMWTTLDGGFSEDDEPTHWMPLPPAPDKNTSTREDPLAELAKQGHIAPDETNGGKYRVKMKWEWFHDPSYFDMWAVRPVDDKDFRSPRLFHFERWEDAVDAARALDKAYKS